MLGCGFGSCGAGGGREEEEEMDVWGGEKGEGRREKGLRGGGRVWSRLRAGCGGWRGGAIGRVGGGGRDGEREGERVREQQRRNWWQITDYCGGHAAKFPVSRSKGVTSPT